MDENSFFQVWDVPKERSLKKIGKKGLTCLFAGGIVNPFGPTLTVVATDGSFDGGKKLPVLNLMLNPFSQESQVVGQATIGKSIKPVQDFSKFFSIPFGSCPTLLLPSIYLNHDESVFFYSQFLQVFPDGYDLLMKVRQFPCDPWNRVQQDVGNLGEILENVMSDQEDEVQPKRLDDAQSAELAAALLEPESLKAEFQAFMYAWNGAIEFQRGHGNRAISKKALSLDEFLKIFSLLAMSCNLPEMNK